jgi:hypothetical protein
MPIWASLLEYAEITRLSFESGPFKLVSGQGWRLVFGIAATADGRLS